MQECPKCGEEKEFKKGPCDECVEEVAEWLKIPEEVVREYADDIGDDDLSSIEEAYVGKFNDDEDFACNMADNLGSVDFKNQPWPQYCIDWEYAAREIMCDYCSYSGYYFRNL